MTRHTTLLLAAALAATALPACAQRAERTSPPAGAALPAGDGGVAVGTYDGKLRVPPGFAVARWAEVPGARFMVLGPDGAVYVSRPRANEIVRLVDADGDGVAESMTTAVSGLDRPHGMAFRDGWFYIANTRSLVRVRLGADGKATGAPQPIATYDGGSGHSTRTVIVGPDGALYVSIGSSCNICVERHQERATVMRYEPDGRKARVFSRGLRNAVGMAVHPGTRKIWVTTHERDNLRPDHQDLPPEEIDILQDGGDYGWPYCWGDRVPNPEFENAPRCRGTIPPALKMQAHSAPLGITFLDRATTFPRDWRGDALVAFHGSWNRDVPTGAKVVRIRVKDGRPTSYEDFIVGWQNESGQRWGRPADVLVHRDGTLLVSDDAAGAIYRVTYTGAAR